jgi:hypothetical protein
VRACRHCHKARYLSQIQGSHGRKRLAAAKLRITQLNSLPSLNEPIAPRAKWKHKNATKPFAIKSKPSKPKPRQERFRKEIDIRAFAYHTT